MIVHTTLFLLSKLKTLPAQKCSVIDNTRKQEVIKIFKGKRWHGTQNGEIQRDGLVILHYCSGVYPRSRGSSSHWLVHFCLPCWGLPLNLIFIIIPETVGRGVGHFLMHRTGTIQSLLHLGIFLLCRFLNFCA